MRSKSLTFLLLVIGLGVLAGFLYSRQPYKLGLDVKGGVRFTYQMDLANAQPEQKRDLAATREMVQAVLTRRASGAFGVAEPVIAPKGEDQFIIEVPGYTNIEEARTIIGTSASIECYHARNVVTRVNPNAPYRPTDRSLDSKEPLVEFERTSGAGGPIKAGTPEYANVIRGWDLILKGDDLKSADAQPRGNGYEPIMTFSPKGAEKLEAWCRRNQNRGEQLAFVLDGKVLSIAPLQDGAILSTNAVIQGEFSGDYVRNLTDLLKQGALPVSLKELSSEKVDPSIGAQALDKMVTAGAIAFGIISLFLIVYYAMPGLMALVALLLYVLFTLTALKLMGATFSLAAIAGFILSVGMAVDANILVFERFKEERKAGRPLTSAIELGFRRALPAIFDSNACTILTSLVLSSLGTGPVKGFATTLIVGVLISLFTAVTVTRSLLLFLVNAGMGDNPKLYAEGRSWFGENFEKTADTKPLRIVEKWRKWFLISIVTGVIGFVFVPLGGLKGNVEFRGGYEAQFSLAGKDVTAPQIAQNLDKAGIRGANVKLGGEGATRVAIVTAAPEGVLQGLDQRQAIDKITTSAGFTKADLKGESSVGPAIQKETINNAYLGVFLSSALIVVFLAFRFGFGVGGFGSGIKFGASAIGALVHDIFVVLGITAAVGWAFGWEISALFITSMLTVIGFSVHDTIVIFDRIRENLHRPLKDEEFGHLVDRSITQSFARSINTSMTVIVTLVILLFFGTTTPDLKLFCATMLAGILSGTYSSIYNASPILYLWDRATAKKRGEEQSLLGLARKEDAKNRVVGGVGVAPVAQAAGAQVTGSDGRVYGQVRRRASANPNQRRTPDIEDL